MKTPHKPKEHAKSKRRRKIAQRDGSGCLLCGYNKGILTLHHKHKISDGGSNDINNLCLLCEPCHTYWHQNEAIDFDRWVEQTRKYLIKIIYD